MQIENVLLRFRLGQRTLDESTEEMLLLSNLRGMLIDFGIWLDKNDKQLENGNITENVDEFLKSIN
jgi:hypothetical protein